MILRRRIQPKDVEGMTAGLTTSQPPVWLRRLFWRQRSELKPGPAWALGIGQLPGSASAGLSNKLR